MTSELALAILLATPALAPEVLDSLGHAPPAMVARLSQSCVGTGDIRITAGEIVYQVRIGRLNAAGMGGFKTRGSAPRPPDPLAWPLVTRMDAVHSSRGLGMMLGAVTGAAIGWPAEAVVLGATAGMWIGGRVGSMRVREVPLYIAQPGAAERLALDPAAAAAAAAVPSLVAAGAVDAASGAVGEPSAERIREACTEIRPGSMLRVTFTSMTLTEGQVSRADDAGLHALRPTLAKGSTPPPPAVIPWARILQVEKRVGSSGRGALYGGISFGSFGAILGLAVVAGGGIGGGSSNAGDAAQIAGGAVVGALICGAIGAGFGALIGAAVPRWRVVY